jgi:hypothetical protein
VNCVPPLPSRYRPPPYFGITNVNIDHIIEKYYSSNQDINCHGHLQEVFSVSKGVRCFICNDYHQGPSSFTLISGRSHEEEEPATYYFLSTAKPDIATSPRSTTAGLSFTSIDTRTSFTVLALRLQLGCFEISAHKPTSFQGGPTLPVHLVSIIPSTLALWPHANTRSQMGSARWSHSITTVHDLAAEVRAALRNTPDDITL